MKVQITTNHYDFTLTSEREDSYDISDIFSRVATIITELQTAAEKAEALVVGNKTDTAVEGVGKNE